MTSDASSLAIFGVAVQLAGVAGREAWTTVALEGRGLPAVASAHTPDGLVDALAVELREPGLPGGRCEVLTVRVAGAEVAVLRRWPAAGVLEDVGSALEASVGLLAGGAELVLLLIVADSVGGPDGVGLAFGKAGRAAVALCELRRLCRGATVAELFARPPQGFPEALEWPADHLELADAELLPASSALDLSGANLGCGATHGPAALRDALGLCKLALALDRATLPAWPAGQAVPQAQAAACPQRLAPWPMHASGRARRAAWCARVAQGVMMGWLDAPAVQRAPARARLADRLPVLLPFAGASAGDIADALDGVANSGASGDTDLHALACRAHAAFAAQPHAPLALALVVGDHDALRTESTFFRSLLRRGADLERDWRTPAGSAFTARPLGGQVAFVYPGYASAYPGAGQSLGYLAPVVQRRLEARFGRHGWAFLHPHRLYPRREDGAEPAFGSAGDDVRALCETTISLSAIYTELARSVLGIQPRYAFGYSIGEAAMLFALGVWDGLADFGERVGASGLFERRLGGPMRTVRDHWRRIGLDVAADRDAWAAVLIRAPLNAVIAAASTEPGAMVSLINTPTESVVAGHPESIARLIARIGGPAMPLSPALPLHCAAVASEHSLLMRLHDLPARSTSGTRFYSSAGCARIAPEQGTLHEVIAKAYTQPVDFPRLVRQVHADGARVFIETGPRRICSTWIATILDGKPHVTVPMDMKGVDPAVALLRAAAVLVTHRVPLDLQALYAEPSGRVAASMNKAIAAAVERPAMAPELASIVAVMVGEVARVLRCPPDLVDPSASLFALGLDSLQAAELAARADRNFGISLDLADVIAGNSIVGVAQLVHRRRLVRQVTQTAHRVPADAGWEARL